MTACCNIAPGHFGAVWSPRRMVAWTALSPHRRAGPPQGDRLSDAKAPSRPGGGHGLSWRPLAAGAKPCPPHRRLPTSAGRNSPGCPGRSPRFYMSRYGATPMPRISSRAADQETRASRCRGGRPAPPAHAVGDVDSRSPGRTSFASVRSALPDRESAEARYRPSPRHSTRTAALSSIIAAYHRDLRPGGLFRRLRRHLPATGRQRHQVPCFCLCRLNSTPVRPRPAPQFPLQPPALSSIRR